MSSPNGSTSPLRPRKPGTGARKPGTGTLKPGTGAFKPGTGAIKPGTGALKPGTGALKAGTGALKPGTGALTPGSLKLGNSTSVSNHALLEVFAKDGQVDSWCQRLQAVKDPDAQKTKLALIKDNLC